MKKSFLFALTFAVLGMAHSQTTIIPKAGVSIATLNESGDEAGDFDSKIGLLLGVGIEIGLSDKLAFQPEILYVQKGASDKSEGVEITFGLNYIEVPLLLKYKISGFYVNVGPYLGYGLGGEATFKSGGEEQTFDIKFGEGEDSEVLYLDNAFEFGAALGGGVVIGDKFQIDARYGLGLSSLNDDGEGSNTLKNSTIQFSVGYILGN